MISRNNQFDLQMCSKTENCQVKFCLKKIKVISTTAVYLPKLSLGENRALRLKEMCFLGSVYIVHQLDLHIKHCGDVHASDMEK